MSFSQLIKDSKLGINKKIYSRKNNFIVSVDEYNSISKKYFSGISSNNNYCFEFTRKDLNALKFILRWYYQLWIDVSQNTICIHKEHPKLFLMTKNFNPSGIKEFKKNTIMYLQYSRYSLCNWNEGIPLWDIPEADYTPYCQVNYDFIKSLK